MTTTETETKPGKFSRAVEKREQQKAELKTRIADLAQKEDEAREAILRRSPSQSAYKLGSDAQKARSDRADAEKTLAGVEAELVSLGGLQAGEQAAQAAEQLKQKINQGAELQDRERAAWGAAGEAFAKLLDARDAVFDVLEERDALITEGESLLPTLDVQDPTVPGDSDPMLGAENAEELKGGWQAVTVYPIAPTPIDTGRFVERLTKATLEAGREDGPGSHPRVDHENVLITLLPDLRSRNRVAQVSPSRVDIISTPGAGGNPGTEFTP